MISSPSQRSDYYRDANQAQSRYPQRTFPPTIYNDMPDSNAGKMILNISSIIRIIIIIIVIFFLL